MDLSASKWNNVTIGQAYRALGNLRLDLEKLDDPPRNPQASGHVVETSQDGVTLAAVINEPSYALWAKQHFPDGRTRYFEGKLFTATSHPEHCIKIVDKTPDGHYRGQKVDLRSDAPTAYDEHPESLPDRAPYDRRAPVLLMSDPEAQQVFEEGTSMVERYVSGWPK